MVSALSILAMSVGIALITRANMGTVAMLCPAYVISAIHGQSLTFGTLLIIMHLMFVAVECILLRSVSGIRILPQLASSVLFGLLLDISMWALHPLQWDGGMAGCTLRILQILTGTIIVGLGFCMHIKTDVLLSADGLAMAFARVLNAKFVPVRLISDLCVVAIAMVFCVYYFGGLRWDMLGIGTLISLAGVWYIYRYLSPRMAWLSYFLEANAPGMMHEAPIYDTHDTLPLVITIARTHGSGGHEIGLKVAERLGIKFYDKEIITSTAKQLGLSDEAVTDAEQTYSIRNIGKSGSIFEAQSRIIRDAAKESCVIIGRCADYVLRDRPYCLNIFARCDEDYAVTMIRNKDNLPESQAREVIRLKNTAREKHYNHFTSQKWQDPLHYDLVINTAKIGIDSAVDIICNAVENILRQDE